MHSRSVRNKWLMILAAVAAGIICLFIMPAQKTQAATKLNVTYLSQSAYPTGCEATSATMVLRYYGVNVSIDKTISNMPKGNLYYSNGVLCGPHPDDKFIGSPYSSGGYGCYAGTVVTTMNKLLPSDKVAVKVTGLSVKKLCSEYIDNGQPVVFWATMYMGASYKTASWKTSRGLYTWRANEHCLVLTGYDSSYYYFNDPLVGKNVAYKKSTVEKRYKELGSQAVVVEDWPDSLDSTTLKTAKIASKGIKVSWESVDMAQGYYVYRKTSSGSWEKIATVSGDSLSYTDTSSKKSGTTYYYTVRAYAKKGSTKITGGRDKTGVSYTYLKTPSLSSASNAKGGVKVKWESVKGAESYRVYRKVKGGSWSKIATVTGTSYTDKSSLKSNKTYYYTVRAVKNSCTSYYKTAGKSVLRLSTPSLSSVSSVSGGIKIKWSKVTGAKKYYIYRKIKGGSWEKIASTTSTSYKDKSSLKAGKTYVYTVRAVNGSTKSYYDTSGLMYKYMKVPSLVSAANAKGGIKVTWKSVKGAEKYRVYRKVKGGSWKKIATVADTAYTDTSSLKSNKTYYYTVRAVSGSYLSYYDTSGISVLRLSTPSLSSASAVSGGIKIEWSKVTGAEKYYVYRKVKGGSWEKIVSTAGTSYKDKSSLKSGTKYYYTVRAVKGSAKGYYDTSGISYVYLSVPALSSVNDSEEGVVFKWKSVSGAESYAVYRKTGKSGEWKKIATVTSASYTDADSSMVKGTTYYYTVRALSGSSRSYYDSDGKSVKKKYDPPEEETEPETAESETAESETAESEDTTRENTEINNTEEFSVNISAGETEDMTGENTESYSEADLFEN